MEEENVFFNMMKNFSKFLKDNNVISGFSCFVFESFFLSELKNESKLKKHEAEFYKELKEYYLLKKVEYHNSLLIAMVGCIGAGKTHLSTEISKKLDLNLYKEPSKNNPYLKDFYENRKKWSFFLQMYLMLQRKKGITNKIGLIDRSFEEDVIFSKVLYEDGDMTFEEHSLHLELMRSVFYDTKKPSVYIYLKTSTEQAGKNIAKRDIISEKNIDLKYLNKLNQTYDWFIEKCIDKNKVITINWVDFGETEQVIKKIDGFLKINYSFNYFFFYLLK